MISGVSQRLVLQFSCMHILTIYVTYHLKYDSKENSDLWYNSLKYFHECNPPSLKFKIISFSRKVVANNKKG